MLCCAVLWYAVLRAGIYHEDLAAAVDTEIMNLPRSEVTIAQALRQRHNYSTMMIGKWHLGEAAGPTEHGFDQSLGFNLLSHYLPATASSSGGEYEGVEYRLPDQLDQVGDACMHGGMNGWMDRGGEWWIT